MNLFSDSFWFRYRALKASHHSSQSAKGAQSDDHYDKPLFQFRALLIKGEWFKCKKKKSFQNTLFCLWLFWHIQLAGAGWLLGETPLVLGCGWKKDSFRKTSPDTSSCSSSELSENRENRALDMGISMMNVQEMEGGVYLGRQTWRNRKYMVKSGHQCTWWLLIPWLRCWVHDCWKTVKDLPRVVPEWTSRRQWESGIT